LKYDGEDPDIKFTDTELARYELNANLKSIHDYEIIYNDDSSEKEDSHRFLPYSGLFEKWILTNKHNGVQN